LLTVYVVFIDGNVPLQEDPLVNTEFNIRTEHVQRTVLNTRTKKQVQHPSVEHRQLSSRTEA